MRIAVYTANYGDVDHIACPPAQDMPADFFIYGADALGWERRRLPKMVTFSNIEQSRIPKCLSTTLFPSYDYTIWVCGLINITSERFVSWCIDAVGVHTAAFFRHDQKRSIAQEMGMCLKYHGGEFIGGQQEYYRLMAVDMDAPVASCNLIIRQWNGGLRAMEAEWLLHQLLFCSNDQIGMTHLMSHYGINWKWLPGSVMKSEHWTRNIYHKHQGGHQAIRSMPAKD